MELGAYFDRIAYSGPRAPDLATLDALTRAHLAAVPFENLDVQLGRPLDLDRHAIFDKLVTRRRGGWCYEQNGLFGWALVQLGFDVQRLSCGVMRVASGDPALGNHLALVVTIAGERWLADVGFGGSQAAPLPLAAGEHAHPPFGISLAQVDDGYWRFSDWADPAKPFSFDFRDEPADEALLAEKCAWLQVGAESPFVQNLVAQRRLGERHLSLRGRVLSDRGVEGEERRLIDSADELVTVLRERFGLDVPEAAGLWERIVERHDKLFPAGAATD